MANRKKTTFDQEAVFKSIIGAGQDKGMQPQAQEQDAPALIEQNTEKENRRKGRPKAEGETKKRVTLALYPSIYSDLQKIAYVKRQSISKIVSELIASYINENVDNLKEYELIKKD